ncbi:MAG: hypothetical protein PHW13_13945 [Methylococcales bacterium]|nr:hypothetical protein [Methylococcales bacterium]
MPNHNHMLSHVLLKHHFTPISLENYLTLHLHINPKVDAEDLKARLEYAIAAKQQQQRCACGAEIWVIGSAEVGLSCFTCITGEAYPDNDYELDFDFIE